MQFLSFSRSRVTDRNCTRSIRQTFRKGKKVVTFAAVIIIVLDGRWLINSNVPASPKDYIHRVGRIARAARGGMVITLVTQYDVERVKQIEASINTKLEEFETNENEVLPLLRAVMVARREAQLKVRSSAVLEKRMINKRKKMLLEGKDPDVKAVKRKRRQKKLTEKVKNK